MKKIIIANWKMHGSKNDITNYCKDLGEQLQDTKNLPDLVLCVPFVYLDLARNCINTYPHALAISLGGQNAHSNAAGAYTGEISAGMLVDVGCSYAIIGHSEYRAAHANSALHDELIAQSVAVLEADLSLIFCIGESLAEYQNKQSFATIDSQLDKLCALLTNYNSRQVIIAYEPIWAIGTNIEIDYKYIESVYQYITLKIKNLNKQLTTGVRIIYGGSITEQNIADLLANTSFNGSLVGGASLHANKFAKICQIVQSQG